LNKLSAKIPGVFFGSFMAGEQFAIIKLRQDGEASVKLFYRNSSLRQAWWQINDNKDFAITSAYANECAPEVI